MELIQNFKNEINENSITCICVIRDEEIMIDHFVSHYIKLGITHFIFIDNNSIDNSVNKLKKYAESLNIRIYMTNDSYAQNKYGLAWVNTILNSELKNKWVMVVDIDELLYLPKNESLYELKDKMIKSNSNILQTLLIDFYPRDVNAQSYENGADFLSHSSFYDKYSKQHLLEYVGHTGELAIKGGMRSRVYSGFDEPVCLNKKSFFYYDFYEKYELQVGMHWILPIDFKPTTPSCWDKYLNWSKCFTDLRYYQSIKLLGHFKFIKPNLMDFFKKRVNQNQDWGDSKEYKHYISENKNTFFDESISCKFVQIDELYKNVLSKIEEQKLIVIISAQRHGSTTLCEKFNNNPQCVSLFEAFGPTGRLSGFSTDTDLEEHVRGVVKSHDWMQKKYLVIKIFPGHNISLKKLLDLNYETNFIFLKRNLLDSYNSYKNALLSGNWGTTPDRQLDGSGLTSHTKLPSEIECYRDYVKRINKFFDNNKKILEKHKIKYNEIWFGEVISDSFEISKYLK